MKCDMPCSMTALAYPTASDIPGDPLNIALVGTQEEVIRAMTKAQWDPADALNFSQQPSNRR